MIRNARRRDLDGSVAEKKKPPAVFNVFIRAIRQNRGGFRHKVLGRVFTDIFRERDLTGRPVQSRFWWGSGKGWGGMGIMPGEGGLKGRWKKRGLRRLPRLLMYRLPLYRPPLYRLPIHYQVIYISRYSPKTNDVYGQTSLSVLVTIFYIFHSLQL